MNLVTNLTWTFEGRGEAAFYRLISEAYVTCLPVTPLA